MKWEYITYCSKSMNIPKNNYTKWIDCGKIMNKIVMRRPMEADYFYINETNTKKLSRYMIDMKIPRREREKLLVIAEGDHVLWVIGGRVSYKGFVRSEERRVGKEC